MRVIGIVGLPGSGKSEAAAVAADAGIPVVTMGDVIRAECRDRGREITEAALGEVATSLREEGGPAAIADRSLPLIEDHLADPATDVVVVDGIRSDAEVDVFEDAFDDAFTLVSVEAPFDIRLDRVRDRGRDPTAEAETDLRARDERETGYGMRDAMDRADVVIENTGTLREFRGRVEAVLDG